MATTQELLEKLTQIENQKPADFAGNVVSQATTNYQNTLNNLEANAPGAYQSKYQPVIDNLMDKIINRKEFSYDFNADPMYQQYKDSYTTLGKQASMNAAANAANLSGGYANSYAVTAAAQANQQYLTQLNNMIPQLAQAAQAKYDAETKNLYNQFNLYDTMENKSYQQYRDKVSDYQANRNYTADQLARSQANDQWQNNYNYQQYRDAVEDWQNSRNYYNDRYNTSLSNDQWNANFEYQKQRDAISDAQWRETFEYQKQQDAANAAAAAARVSSGGSSGGSRSNSSSASSSSKALSMDEINYLINGSKGKGSSAQQYSNVQNAVAAAMAEGRLTQAQAEQVMETARWYATQQSEDDKRKFKDSQVRDRR